MSDDNKTYSVTLRLQRITYEDAFVAVPVTDAITEEKEDGSIGLNVEALFSEAVRISKDQRVDWKAESSETEPHPIQSPVPEDRFMFDAFYSDENND
ncbi:MAG: hypothetical protein OEZ39_19815 [Gammaproteobacteria bacterium]|nr:hypothetical protein [Gammaproteobacteria bacterium]MDH5654115.1 hypothetical protein [Gammaproteobacteria bacterium]